MTTAPVAQSIEQIGGRRGTSNAVLSICIPQYNRAQFLLRVLQSIEDSDYREVEVIVSDDCSTDETAQVVPEFIRSSRGDIAYHLFQRAKNVGYDANLRTALSHAGGEYLMILGNDDAVAEAGSISSMMNSLAALDRPEVALVNLCQFSDRKQVSQRVKATGLLGQGPEAARAYFRKFSIVCGLVVRRDAFRRFDSSKYDGSVYFQVYLASAILASGGRLAGIAEPIVAKDVAVEGRFANSYRDNLKVENASIAAKTGGLDQVARLALEGIGPFVKARERHAYRVDIFCQILRYSYPFWLLDYRQRGAFRAALNLALGCRPSQFYRSAGIGGFRSLRVSATYWVVTCAGLALPVRLLSALAAGMKR